MRGLAFVMATGALLGGCDQICGPAVRPVAPPVQACAKPFERTVSFTSPQPGDKVVVEALGPDCSNPSLVGRVFDAKGRLVYTEMTSGKWMMNTEIFPVGGGTAQGAVDALYDIGEANSASLPTWKEGAEPQRGNYGAYEVLVPQIAYERLRLLNQPMLIRRGGGESGTIYIYDPEAAMAIAIARFAV